MKNSIKAATAEVAQVKQLAKLVIIPEVETKLSKAVGVLEKANASVYQLCREAAALAVAQLDEAIDSVEKRIDKVLTLYADALKGNRNVTQNFRELLRLKAAGTQPLSFEMVKTVKGEKVVEEVHTTAAEAAEMPKHYVSKAATELNSLLGTGRKKSPRVNTGSASASVKAASETKVALTDLALADRCADALKRPEFQEELVQSMLDANLLPESVVKTLQHMVTLAKKLQ
jgi:hypothetical protein